jgi:nicotinamidase/pyrazinamidase
MAQRVHMVIIDPNNDFMDKPVPGVPSPALAVPGASDGAVRLAAMIDRLSHRRLDDITVTLDSHHLVDVGHPTMWVGADGKTPPPPFTAIRADDIRSGIWTPRFADAKPPALDGETVRQYMIRYASTLEEQGQHLLMVWTVHCLIGSPGHAVQPDVFAALNRWAGPNFANIDFVTKGTNPWTEHYGALQAEVPMASDPSTGLNVRILETLDYADIVPVLGWARTHCLRESITQIADNVDEKLVRKLWLITDCTADIPAVPNGPDFPAMADAWQAEMVDRGLNLTTSTEFLA